jgi:hypothetical protein
VPSFFVAGMLLWLLAQLMYETLVERPIDVWGALLPHLLVSLVGLAGFYVTGAVGYMMLGMIRHAAFLDGTRLAVRYVLRRKWVDLATAQIDASYDPRRGGVRLLVARDLDTGVEVMLPVTQGPEPLPAGELIALADAITSRRVQVGPDDGAFVVADRLRELAAGSATEAGEVTAEAAAPSRRSGEGTRAALPWSGPRPDGLPSGRARSRDWGDVLGVAALVVLLMAGVVAFGFLAGQRVWGVVIAVVLGLSIVREYRRQLRTRRDRADESRGRRQPGGCG